jgi:dihydroxy-acid dehydratase
MKEILPTLHGDQVTANGRTIAENVGQAECYDRNVIRSVENPVHAKGAFAVLHGSLAPNGAVLKTSAASTHLLQHTGPALVFENYEEMLLQIDEPSLDVREDNVLVLKNAGPIGGPGMPEWGQIPIPAKLLKRGVKDMVRISDSRMSGTSFGAVVLHIAPEAAVGGPLAIVQNGDLIRLDVQNRRLDLLVAEEELQQRLKAWQPRPRKYSRSYYTLFVQHVLQADRGCDFDFLVGNPADPPYEPVVGRS